MQQKWFTLLALFVGAILIAITLSQLVSSHAYRFSSNDYGQESLALAVTSPVQLPENYKQQFMHYATVDCRNSRVVR